MHLLTTHRSQLYHYRYCHTTVHCYTHQCPQSVTVSTSSSLEADFNAETNSLAELHTSEIIHDVFSAQPAHSSEVGLTLYLAYNISARTT
jgi:hypothetical protein